MGFCDSYTECEIKESGTGVKGLGHIQQVALTFSGAEISSV